MKNLVYLAVFALPFWLTASAAPVVVWDSFPDNAYDTATYHQVGYPGSGTQSFSYAVPFMPYEDVYLYSVTVAYGNPNEAMPNLTVEILEGDMEMGLPAATMETLAVDPSVPVPDGVSTFYSSLMPRLNAFYDYWLLIKPTDPTYLEAFEWYQAPDPFSTDLAKGLYDYSSGEFFGYSSEFVNEPAFRVEGIYIPEPSTAALLALGALAVTGAAWRRRAKR